MNLDFRSEMALAGARAFAAGRQSGQTGAQGSLAQVVVARPADDTTVTEIIATIVTEATKELAAAS
jgi:hypothetical protein